MPRYRITPLDGTQARAVFGSRLPRWATDSVKVNHGADLVCGCSGDTATATAPSVWPQVGQLQARRRDLNRLAELAQQVRVFQ